MMLWVFVDMMLFKPSNMSDEAVALSLRACFQLMIVCKASLISLLFVTYSWLNIFFVNCNVVFLSSVIKWQGTYFFLPLPKIRSKRSNQTISLWSTSRPDSHSWLTKICLTKNKSRPSLISSVLGNFLKKEKQKCLLAMLVLSPLDKKIVQFSFMLLQ